MSVIQGVHVKSRLAIRVLNYCRLNVNVKHLNDVKKSDHVYQ